MRPLSKAITACALPLALLATAGCYAKGEEASASSGTAQQKVSEAGLELVPLEIRSGTKSHKFLAEIAGTDAQQAQGLMFRQRLAPNAGMIFPFPEDKMASFWMKNTVISLDIIFVRRDGTIESIAANTTPYSLDPVQSGEPVAAVLELAGGRAAELGIGAGDQVVWQQ